jgi:hypothetical protein
MCALLFVFFACGIEEYIYLPPVPESSVVTPSDGSRATIQLPQIDAAQFYYFTNFAIFYRIYISGTSFPSATITPSQYSMLNAALSSDYNAFLPYTDVTTNAGVSAGAVGALFKNRNYWKLEIQDASIDGILEGVGQIIEIDFQSVIGRAPTLSGNGVQYVLNRSDGEGAFSPVPDRRFLNTAELNSTANATTWKKNADVAPVSGSPSGEYAYAAMYIVAMGVDNNFSPIYSSPTFLGVFRLPD